MPIAHGHVVLIFDPTAMFRDLSADAEDLERHVHHVFHRLFSQIAGDNVLVEERMRLHDRRGSQTNDLCTEIIERLP